MFTNYLVVAMRQLLGNRLFSVINIAGLAVGFACFMLIGLYLRDELGYDRGYNNADRIYRISRDIHLADGSPDVFPAGNGPLEAGIFKQEFEDVEQTARLRPLRIDVARDSNGFAENAVFADNELFAIFDFEWLRGDASAALLEPFTIVLTESTARKYFGSSDAIGQTLTLQGEYPAQVTGVIADLPADTHLDFDMLMSMPTATTLLGANALANPSVTLFHTYVLLRPGATMSALAAQVPALYERLYGEGASAVWGLTAMPLQDIHLRSRRDGELSQPGSTSVVYAFSAIAVVILLLACFNFMNLATARGMQRAKEVGVRKALGAERMQMMMQFISEAVLTASVAMLLALGLVELMLPAFSAFLQRELQFTFAGEASVVPLLVLVVGLVAGSYPAFYLSSFIPSLVLKGMRVAGKGAAMLRASLVVLQFAIAIVLLVATAVVFLQLRFTQSIELGYAKDQVLVLTAPGREGLGRQWDALKGRLQALPGVSALTASNIVPGSSVGTNYNVRYEGSAEQRTMPVLLVDFGFFETYDIDVLAGRSFSAAQDGERAGNAAYVINELAARQLGWTAEEAVGKTFEVTCCNFGSGTIIGVVRDVYFESLHSALAPAAYIVPPEPGALISSETRLGLRQASIAIDGSNTQQVLADIRAVWAEFFPGVPASLRFLDDDFAVLYQAEARQNQMLFVFSAIAIFIACLGLYGLAAFSAERRRKEIGVRKVLGGSVWSIVVLITNEFSKLVLLSNILAWPIAWFAMSNWLQNFAYRIDLGPLVFIGSGITALCIAWVTVGGTAAKAASNRPVLALRYE